MFWLCFEVGGAFEVKKSCIHIGPVSVEVRVTMPMYSWEPGVEGDVWSFHCLELAFTLKS